MFMSEFESRVISDMYDPVARTRFGLVRGIKKGGTYIFRGVPYAKAGRFRPAEDPEPWEGVFEALAYGPSCPLFITSFGKDQLYDPHYYTPQSENCHNLNIWTQSLDEGAKKPVLVWIHGGGWKTGSAVEQYAYDGEELSKFGDIVVVSVNHRLNCFGCLDLSSFGSRYERSGMLTIDDLVAALRWVRDNIASFGGDPDKVTLAGQSGGSAKVGALLQCPEADGLYRGAMADGDWDKRLRPQNGHEVREYTRRMGELTAEKLGLDRENIEQIETVPYYDLMDACIAAESALREEMGVRYSYDPVPDGKFWVGHPFDVGVRQETIHIPMLLGGCFGEHDSNVERPMGPGPKGEWDEEQTMACMREKFGGMAERVAGLFRQTWPEKPLADAVFMDRSGRWSTLRYAQMRAAQGGRVWNHRFDLESPMSGGMTAWHCSELHYFFHNAGYNEASFIPGVTERLEEQMAGAWIAFIKNGDPNNACLPHWPEITVDCLPTMYFDRETRLYLDKDRELVELLHETTFPL